MDVVKALLLCASYLSSRTRASASIKPQDGFKNMFFHVSGDGNEHAQSLVKGQAVSYLPARNRRGPCAIFIKAETQETSRDDTLLETADARQIRARCDA